MSTPYTRETFPDKHGYFARTEYKFNNKNILSKQVYNYRQLDLEYDDEYFLRVEHKLDIHNEIEDTTFSLMKYIGREAPLPECVSYGDLVFMEPPPVLTKIHIVEEKQEHTDTKKCKNCGGDHWVLVCPTKESNKARLKKDKVETLPTAPPLYDVDKDVTVQILNISPTVTDYDLYDLFSSIGHIKRIYIAKDYETKKSRGFGYVMFRNSEHAETCMKKYNNFGFNNLLLKISLVNPK